MGRFLLPFTNFTRSEHREISSLQKERGTSGGKKEKETLLIEGFSINVSCRKGIIFSARKRPLHLFSAIFLGPPPRPLLPFLFRGIPSVSRLSVRAGNLLERTDVFFRRFSYGTSSPAVAAIVVGILLGIDNAQDAAGIRPSIIVEDKSVWRRIRDIGVSGW